jgi:hypothetical protein
VFCWRPTCLGQTKRQFSQRSPQWLPKFLISAAASAPEPTPAGHPNPARAPKFPSEVLWTLQHSSTASLQKCSRSPPWLLLQALTTLRTLQLRALPCSRAILLAPLMHQTSASQPVTCRFRPLCWAQAALGQCPVPCGSAPLWQ